MQSTGRLVGVDAARGVALLGMMSVHVLPIRAFDGTVAASYRVAGGRSAAAFAVLAGVGLALTAHRPRLALVVRAAAIGAVGLMLAYPDSGVAVILPYYAVLFVLAVPLVRLGPRVLAALAGSAAVVVPVVSHLLRPHLDAPSLANPTFGSVLRDPVGLATELTITGYYPALAWLTYLCAGMAVGKLDLRSPRVAGGLLGGGLVLAGVTWLTSAALMDSAGAQRELARSLPFGVLDQELAVSQHGTTSTDTWWWLAVISPHSSTPFDLLHTTGTSLALLGAALLLARVGAGLLLPLAAAGGMTLTLYTAHVALLGTPLLPEDPQDSYVLQVIMLVAFAMVWRLSARRGPLESAISALAQRIAGRPGPRGPVPASEPPPGGTRPDPARSPP